MSNVSVSRGPGAPTVWVQIEDNFDGCQCSDWAELSLDDAKVLRDQLLALIETLEAEKPDDTPITT